MLKGLELILNGHIFRFVVVNRCFTLLYNDYT